MFRLSGKIVKKNNTIVSHTFEINKDAHSFEALMHRGIADLCNRFDIGNPIWLSDNTLDMERVNKTRFKAHHFIEEIEYLPENP